VTGFGADELLGGYPRYHLLDKTTGVRQWIPRGFLAQIDPALPPNAFVQRASHYLAVPEDDQARAYLSLTAVFDEAERETLYTDAMQSALGDSVSLFGSLSTYFEGVSFARGAMAFELGVGLPDLLLHECDRFAAAHGVTLRHPYMDDGIVDFVLRTPPEILNGVRSKPLLRMAMKGLLPARIRLRPRHGFRFPQSGPTWRTIESAARAILTPERVEASGIFKWRSVEPIIRGANHNVYRRRQFWSLLLFYAWYRATMEA
jgi:asparagine synthase (glutamine-hydrolysing)